MKIENLVGTFDPERKLVLMCLKTKGKFKDKFNFPGGKKEIFERSKVGAYREFAEETGIKDVKLVHIHDSIFYYRKKFLFFYIKFKFKLQYYVCKVDSDKVNLVEEINPLEFQSLKSDFTNMNIYAGNGDMYHLINLGKKYYNIEV